MRRISFVSAVFMGGFAALGLTADCLDSPTVYYDMDCPSINLSPCLLLTQTRSMSAFESERTWSLTRSSFVGGDPMAIGAVVAQQCALAIPTFDDTARLSIPRAGCIIVRVDSRGPELVDSTFVRPIESKAGMRGSTGPDLRR